MNLPTSVSTPPVAAIKEIEVVTFDAGGTLIEPWPSVGAVYAEVAREFGIECRADRLSANFIGAWASRTAFRYTRGEWAEVVRESFAGLGEVTLELFDAIYERFAEPRAWLIYDDVIPALQTLDAMGIRLAVISNWDERLAPLLEKLGLAAYFEEIVVSSLAGAHKPDGRIFARACELLGVRPEQVLHIGDSSREDVDGARGAGAKAARIRRSGMEEADDILRLTAIPTILEKAINTVKCKKQS